MVAFWLLTAEEHVTRYTQLFVTKILARKLSLLCVCMCVRTHHSQMPVSASVSITCKHLLIVCEQMLAVSLFPSVIPVPVCAWPRHCAEMCSWLFPLPDDSNSLDRRNMFVNNSKINCCGLLLLDRASTLLRLDCSPLSTRKYAQGHVLL